MYNAADLNLDSSVIYKNMPKLHLYYVSSFYVEHNRVYVCSMNIDLVNCSM